MDYTITFRLWCDTSFQFVEAILSDGGSWIAFHHVFHLHSKYDPFRSLNIATFSQTRDLLQCSSLCCSVRKLQLWE